MHYLSGSAPVCRSGAKLGSGMGSTLLLCGLNQTADHNGAPIQYLSVKKITLLVLQENVHISGLRKNVSAVFI